MRKLRAITTIALASTVALVLSVVPGVDANTPTGKQGSLRDVVEDLVDGVRDLGGKTGHFLQEEVHRTFLAGNILPFFNKLWLTPTEFNKLCKTLGQVADWQDVIFLSLIAFATVPLTKFPYERFNQKNKIAFQRTTYHLVADHLQQISRVALLAYLADIIKVVLIEMGFTWDAIPKFPHVFARSLYTLWAARRMSIFKRWLLCRMWHRRRENMGRMEVIDHLFDAVLGFIAVMLIVDVLSVELGFAAKSIFAFGSVGTLVVSFASQGIVSNLMNGLLLSASDRCYEGDKVKFGNGIEGTVVNLGWMETVVRGSDEVMVTVPNSNLASQTLSNLSRLRKCQIKQELSFNYKDAAKLPELCEAIKREVKKSCPELISDGSRPFRCHWISYEQSHLKVLLEAHFSIRPLGDGYWINRQKVLEAINRAVEKNGMEFEIIV